MWSKPFVRCGVWVLTGWVGVAGGVAAVPSGARPLAWSAPGATTAPTTAPATGPTTAPANVPFPALVAPLTLIDGSSLDLQQYKGRVVMIVPVAWDSNRRQFEDLQLYYDRVRDRGVVVIGVLTADFNAESRSDKDLQAAIRERYKLTLPLAATTKIKGPDAHPAFRYFASTTAGHTFGGEIKGPFTKFIVDRNGELAGRWEPAHRINNNEDFRTIIDIINVPMR